MRLELTEEQEKFRLRTRELVEREIAPTAAERDDREEFDRGIFDKVGQAGLAGIPFPEQYGGAGLDVMSYAIGMEEIARGCPSTVLALNSHAGLGAWTIFASGDESQKQTYLVPLAKGTKLGCFSITEPKAGSDAGAMETVATPTSSGYVLSGLKVFATNAGEAETYVIFAMTDRSQGTRGISAFVLEKGMPGLSFGMPVRKVGMRASVQREILLTDCEVPKSNLLGAEGSGFKVAMGALDLGRIGIAAQGVGIAQGAFDQATAYAKERIQFGKPIGQNQAIQFAVADMAVGIETARLLTYKAAYLQSVGKKFSDVGAMAKMYATDVAMKTATDAVQLLGGFGCTRDATVELYMRDAKVAQVYEGTNQIMRMIVGSGLLR